VFVVGLLAYQGRWLTKMSTRQGMLRLRIGLALSAPRCMRPFGSTGGFSAGTLMRSTWEAFECVSLCIGLLVAFRELVSSARRRLQVMAPSAYGVCIIHVFVVVPLQFAVIELAAAPLVKFALVVLLAVPISFNLAALLRRLPAPRAVLSRSARGRAAPDCDAHKVVANLSGTLPERSWNACWRDLRRCQHEESSLSSFRSLRGPLRLRSRQLLT